VGFIDFTVFEHYGAAAEAWMKRVAVPAEALRELHMHERRQFR
jgi:hypothetical protein